jgi:hypothetical protein
MSRVAHDGFAVYGVFCFRWIPCITLACPVHFRECYTQKLLGVPFVLRAACSGYRCCFSVLIVLRDSHEVQMCYCIIPLRSKYLGTTVSNACTLSTLFY